LLEAGSWYNALQVRFQKRPSHYISVEGSYTWAKATDDSSSGANQWIGNLQYDSPQVLDNLGVEHGISANDTAQRFTVAVVFDIPVGRGLWIGNNMGNVMNGIIGGWSLSGFVTLQSGQPLAIFMANPRLADGNQRPNVICSQLTSGLSFTRAAETGQSYLNSDCFADPGDNITGNSPRHFSSIRGPGIRNLDLSLYKDFNIKEGVVVQIRAEMFNTTNTPRFAFPAGDWGNDDFGLITSTTNNFRRMQFGARFQF